MSDCTDLTTTVMAPRLRGGMTTISLRAALLGASVALLAPIGLAVAADGSGYRIEAVTLSAGGLAEIRRGVQVDGASDLGFDVPLDQVSDILKSLLVYDAAGGVASIRLDGPSPVEETFRGLPFTPEDMNGLPSLLKTLQGTSVRVTSGGRTVEGMVMGVAEDSQPAKDDSERGQLLSVMTAEGQIAVLRLRSDTQLDILDVAMRDKLRAAATVSGKSRVEDMRTINVGLEGTGERDVFLDYVVPAPIWKTAYRLMLDADGKARLQAWAVIENATGEDWSNVAITLSSGAPVTLSQRLYERYWHERQDVPVLAQSVMAPPPDLYKGGAVDERSRLANQDMAYEMMAVPAQAVYAPAPISMSPSAPVAQATASDGQTAAIYRLPMPVDLGAGQTLSVPYIDTTLDAERIAIFYPDRGDTHPISALKLENATGTSLPPGIVTVYAPQEEGYAGDAQLMGVPSAESRILSFAADRKVEVTTERGNEQTSYRATIANGVLRIISTTRADTTYTIKGAPDASRTVIIEHPRLDGWTFTSDALDEDTPTNYRLRAEVEAGGTATVKASIERTNSDEVALIDADPSTLLYWSNQVGNAKTTAALDSLTKLRSELAKREQALGDIVQQLYDTTAAQSRVRENLAAVPSDSTLAQRYISMLEQQEDQIAALEMQRREAEKALSDERDAFAKAVQAL
ncbi:DUF4139 domain-containing protein [Devosia epidermidihirudinis]|nr:DUF4139 domain-containing protein [Devosia epidermidihirudinis]